MKIVRVDQVKNIKNVAHSKAVHGFLAIENSKGGD